MNSYSNNLFKQIPCLRLLLPLIVGILLQYHFNLSINLLLVVSIISLIFIVAIVFISTYLKFKLRWVQGVFLTLLFIGVGGCLSYAKNISNRTTWVGNYFIQNEPLLVTLQENLAIKQKSYKALATVEAVYKNNNWQSVEGDVLLYFRKDSTIPPIQYGSQILIKNNVVSIVNSGNPGGFNYARFCSFQQIHFQGFLKDQDFSILTSTKTNWFIESLINIRTKVLSILKANIKNPSELSIAQALLIGYRDELDRDLVKAYSNTGVVHIIAISGLHLGMIYGLMLFLFLPFKKYKWCKIIKPITIIFVLWIFSFIAGMPPSILRSALMFSCIAIGEPFGKQSNIFNGLAVSAFIILIINPFSLWDVGFQLSYSAVLSIVIFSPYIKRWIYFKNKILAGIWNLNSITLSAQILTLPFVLYHFHQFPNLFLFTNLFAVPLSGLILYFELLLLIISSWNSVAFFIGGIIEWLIKLMNQFIVKVDRIPFAVCESIQITIVQAIILIGLLVASSVWLINKKIKYLILGLIFLMCFIAVRSIDFVNRNLQQKIIVYNVPSHTAIDLVEGRNYQFIGDSILQYDGFLRNFHIKPSRILHRINEKKLLKNIQIKNQFIYSNNKVIAVVFSPINYSGEKIKVDAIIITKNPRIYISKLHQIFDCKLYVFDGSNPVWKINKWKKECDSLSLQYHISSLEGAFEMNL